MAAAPDVLEKTPAPAAASDKSLAIDPIARIFKKFSDKTKPAGMPEKTVFKPGQYPESLSFSELLKPPLVRIQNRLPFRRLDKAGPMLLPPGIEDFQVTAERRIRSSGSSTLKDMLPSPLSPDFLSLNRSINDHR
jgi:hypothetical protein